MSTPSPSTPHAWFATTQWSQVLSAGRADGADSREALEALCCRYWVPLYSYVRRQGCSPEDSQDLTQEFFARLVEQNRVARADREKGRFRSFLLASLKNFLSDQRDRRQAQKRGGRMQFLPLHTETGEMFYAREPVDDVTPEQIYERRWALTLLENVLTTLRSEQERAGKEELFAAVSPCLIGERALQPYAELAEKLGMSEASIKTIVHRLRRRYRDLLRQEVAHTVATPEEVDEELRYLLTVLSRR